MKRHASDEMKSVNRSLVHQPLTRRSFINLAATSSTLLGGVHLLKGHRAYAATARPPLRELPSLDGELRFTDADRQAAASDFGRHIHRAPIAVLKPGSVHDVVRMVAYANKHGLKIAMRGQGHCFIRPSASRGRDRR